MKKGEVGEIFKDISDYLAPLQTPYEQAIYNYLFRWSYLESGKNIVRKGKRTIAIGIGRASGAGGYGSGRVSYGAADENIKSLEKKGHIRIGNVTREGTLYTVLLPMEIEECIELKQRREGISNVNNVDYFNVSENRIKIFERDNYTCHYCGSKVTKENATLDHFVPSSRGGDNSKQNLVTSCLECNSIKSGRTFEEAAPDLLKRLKDRKAKE
jgi:hypothetical protein